MSFLAQFIDNTQAFIVVMSQVQSENHEQHCLVNRGTFGQMFHTQCITENSHVGVSQYEFRRQ